MSKEQGPRVDHGANTQPKTALKTYNRNGKHKRTCEGGNSNADRKNEKRNLVIPVPNTSFELRDQFIVDAIGTGSGSKKDMPLKELQSVVPQRATPSQQGTRRQEGSKVKKGKSW
jgi:hypothetical protein